MHKHAHSHGPRQTIGKLGTDITALVGHTPLIRLHALSELTGCEILGKAEFMNPGGSVKDRAALSSIEDAEHHGQLKVGGVIVEASGGNMGIGLTLLGRAKGYSTIIVVPDYAAPEKIALLTALGADVRVVRAVPYSDPANYNHIARDIAKQTPGAWWCNQFDNTESRHTHYHTTGEEIWEQTGGRVTGFAAAAGTGATLAGVAEYLKEMNSRVRICCVDPQENSVIEGVGRDRVTKNFEGAPVDEFARFNDPLMLEMLHFLFEREGLFVGGSSALNVCGALKMARDMGPGQVIVTMLCDGGARYVSKLFNPEWLESKKLAPQRDWGKHGERLVERVGAVDS